MAKQPSSSGSYGADSIQILEGLDPVRKRPGMYIGTTGLDGLHHLIWEIFDNSRDEAMGGHADRIEVALLPHNRIRVADNGRGIPVDIHKQSGVSALETILTTLHAGGKFGGDGYKVSGGLHGVGASVVNALSIYMKAEVHRDGGIYTQEYSEGKPQPQKQAKGNRQVSHVGQTDKRGTIIIFEADKEIFKEIKFDFDRIVHHLRQQAYLVQNLEIHCLDLRESDIDHTKETAFYYKDAMYDCPSMSFFFDGGLLSFVRFYNQSQKPIHKNIFYTSRIDENFEGCEIAFQYTEDITAKIIPFANNIFNPEGGTHITGFKTALTRTINAYAKKNGMAKDSDEAFTGDDCLEGITAVISVKLREIQFEGQTKAKLGSPEARPMVESAFSEGLDVFLEERPDDAKAIIGKIALAQRARKAAKATKDSILRKGALEGMTLPGKLADCQSKSAADSELFIVEGESAGGTAKSGRDRRTQAILPLRGKILNTERARLDRMLASEQVKNLVIALGTAIGDTFNIEKLRYHKIIIATDADVDGAHIRTLILTLLYRYFRQLIEGGFVYIAQPPLYKIKRGKEVAYAYDDAQKVAILGSDSDVAEVVEKENVDVDSDPEEEAEADTKKRVQKVSIQRYKGLGEMNADELWGTTMDPKVRVLKKVHIDDAEEADRIFDVLMGTDVVSRKSFIQSNAKSATIDM